MLKLIVCIIILVAVCCAEKQLKCSISKDRQINLLRDQCDCLSQEVEMLKNRSKKTLYLIASGSKLLYFSPDFYIYELTPGRQSWQESRQYCQNWGGDLAVYGVKTLENRKKLIQKLEINQDYVWIGASDFASEGDWIWVNGEHASSSELIWGSGQPQGGRRENYLVMIANPSSSNVGRAHDAPNVNWSRQGICEKSI